MNAIRPGMYTLDDFPLDPAADFHQVAQLRVDANGSYTLEGSLNGRDVTSAGRWEMQEDKLVLNGRDRSIALEVGALTPDKYWMGAHVALEERVGGIPSRTYPVTVHRPADETTVHGPLTYEEHGLVGHHTLSSQRYGWSTVDLHADRSGVIDGIVDGRPVHWEGRWMSAAPMTYLVVNARTTIGIHNEHGGHGSTGGHHFAAASNEIDLIVNDIDKPGEYTMQMTREDQHL